MGDYIRSLPDGWTIYVWLVAGALIIVAAIYGIFWAKNNEQFDEDIKYLVFDEKDQDKMDPKEFAKAQRVLKEQTQRRTEVLQQIAKEREQRARSRK